MKVLCSVPGNCILTHGCLKYGDKEVMSHEIMDVSRMSELKGEKTSGSGGDI